MISNQVKDILDQAYERYNRFDFIKDDPILIPHQYSKKEDIEIAGFFASILAWGQRITIINKCNHLMNLMDNSPYDFILNHSENDLKPFVEFKHRTFNGTDTLFFIHFLKTIYLQFNSLELAFSSFLAEGDENIEKCLIGFDRLFQGTSSFPKRSAKHIASPARKSTCKRLNMYLRWMVRKDDRGVDFGIWDKIKPSQLICPCDVHVERVARKFGILQRKQRDWQAAIELTSNLASLDSNDPVKYDFALFGIGLEESKRGLVADRRL